MSLRRTTGSQLDIHIPFIHALAASDSPDSVQRFMLHVRWILERCDTSNPTLMQTFMSAILQLDNLPVVERRAILSLMSQRIAASHSAHINMATSRWNENRGHGSHDIHSLVEALAYTLFGLHQTGQSNPVDQYVSPWAIAVTKAIFCAGDDASDAINSQWNCLVILALACTRSARGSGRSSHASSNPVQQAAIVEWHTVCVLASIENLFRCEKSNEDPLSGATAQGLTDVIRTKWIEWSELHASVAPPRSALVTRIICASFIRIGGHLKARTLVDTCREYCVRSDLWSVRGNSLGAGAGLQTLASEQLFSSLVSGTFFERALVNLAVLTDDIKILRGAIDTAVQRYAMSDPEHAQEFVAWATSRGIPPSGEAVSAVGVAYAEQGNSAYLDRYLTSDQLSPASRADVASAHLRMYIRYRRDFIEPAKVAETLDTFYTLAAQLPDPTAFLTLLESAMIVLIRDQQGSQVLELVEGFGSHRPSPLSVTTYTHLLRALLRHSQYSLAQRLLLHALPMHPQEAHRWTSFFLFRLGQAGARRLAAKFEQNSQTTHAPSMRVYRPESNPSSETMPESPRECDLAPTVIAPGDPYMLHQSIISLIRAGESSAAAQFYDVVKDQAPPDVRTHLANLILHDILFMRRSSNNRRLRHLLLKYEQLKEEEGFVPDHVTVNILLKGFLRSPADLNAPMARQLFDALVRFGYPTGTPAPPQDDAQGGADLPPFGTKATRVRKVFVGRLEIPRVDAPVSYMRHVLPLYKMFIKAFYERNDAVAARKVVGIVKTLNLQHWGRRQIPSREKKPGDG